MNKTDWVGKWFGILEELGELPLIAYGKLHSDSETPEWIFLKHEDYDGIGGMVHLLREEGYAIKEPPLSKVLKKPGIFESASILLKAQKVNRITHMPWVNYDPTLKGQFQGIAWNLFSEVETEKIATSAKAQGISVNTLLLWCLDQASLPLFKTSEFTRLWMVPVNMRGNAKRARDTSNHASYLQILIQPEMKMTALQSLIKHELKSKSHWGNWYSILSGKLMGISGMRKTLKNYREKAHNWAGVFSNLGDWPRSEDSPSGKTTHHWLFGMPVTQGHPIGAGCMNWKGRLGITLQFHISLEKTPVELEHFLHSWKTQVLQCIE